MKHKNNRGFTLIELLAVIVIMGILMMVAIPAMSRVIENSRKDTFIETAQTYTNAVNTLWKADSLYCGSEGKLPSTLGEGEYFVPIDSSKKGLVERGGKSSWGNKDVYGYVKVTVSFDLNGNRKEKYSVAMADGVHGIEELKTGTTNDLKRSHVLLKINKDSENFKVKGMTCVTDGKGIDEVVKRHPKYGYIYNHIYNSPASEVDPTYPDNFYMAPYFDDKNNVKVFQVTNLRIMFESLGFDSEADSIRIEKGLHLYEKYFGKTFIDYVDPTFIARIKNPNYKGYYFFSSVDELFADCINIKGEGNKFSFQQSSGSTLVDYNFTTNDYISKVITNKLKGITAGNYKIYNINDNFTNLYKDENYDLTVDADGNFKVVDKRNNYTESGSVYEYFSSTIYPNVYFTAAGFVCTDDFIDKLIEKYK